MLIVVDATLFPFSGWRDLGLAPYAFLEAGWPPRPLPFDLIVNAIGYLPLGILGGLALHPRLRGIAMIVVATIGCALVSIHLEALQTYLPSRVASKVDVLANVAGGALGAVMAARFAHPLLDTGRLRVWRTRWFAADASRGLVLVVVWFGALVYPDAFVLGTGGLLKAFDPSGSDLLASLLGLSDPSDTAANALRFEHAETAVTGLTLLAAGLLFLNLTRQGLAWSRRFVLMAAFVVATVAIAGFARAFLFDEFTAWPLLTAGARSGIAVALAGLVLATWLPRRVRSLFALVAVLVALAIVNVYPDNPYGSAVGLAWTRGKLLNFYGLASGLNLVWPYLAIAWLLRHWGSPTGRDRQRITASPKPGVAGPSL